MKKIIHKENLKNWLLVILSLIIACFAVPNLPESIPTHFNVEGVADDFGSRYTVFMFPAILFTIIICAELFRNIDPKKENYEKFSKFYYSFFFAFNLLFIIVELIVISYALGFNTINTTTLITCAVGILFAFIGNMLPKIKPNYHMGIKTSWALADANNWYKTHRLGGKIWTIGGIILAFIPFILKPEQLAIALLVITLIMSIIPAIASYVYFVKDKT